MQIMKLKDLCKGKGEYGIAAAAEDYSPKKTRYLRITDISDFGELLNNDPKSISCPGSEVYLLNEGDIVFARTGNSTGRTFYYEKKYGPLIFAGFLIRFSPDPQKVNPKFLKYYTISKTYKDWISASQGGSTRGNMAEGDFANMPIFLPSRGAQDALVSIMDNLSDKISNNNAIISELEVMAKDLYDYWFVQFDFPDENGKPYKSSGGKMVWNEELKREIPEGWTPKTIGESFEVLLGGTPSTERKDFWNGSIPWLNSGEVAKSPVLKSEKTITELGRNSSATEFAQAGAVVMSITRYIRPSILGINACFNQSVVAVIPTNAVHTSFIYPLMLSNVERYMGLRTGAQQPHINKETVKETVFVLPCSKVLTAYYEKVDPVYERQLIAAKENAELESLRDWLLPMLMNGQVKIGNNTGDAK